MAYNLRTGLTGSGDIDINVSLAGLNASNITEGVFATARIPALLTTQITGGIFDIDRIPALGTGQITSGTAFPVTFIPVLAKTKVATGLGTGQWHVEDIPVIGTAKISDLDAAKLTGTIDALRIPGLPTTQITTGTPFPLSFIPDIPTGKLLGQIGNAGITDLDAAKLTGTIDALRIPGLPATQITSGTFPKSRVSTAETWHVDDIPSLPATKVSSGELDPARIPNLSALKIQSDTLDAARVPNLDASKITTGTISSDRLPSTLDIIGYKAVTANIYKANAIGTSWELIDSNTLMSFTVPPSRLVEIELNMFVGSLSGETIYAKLVNGGTSDEFAEDIIDDDTMTPSTDFTIVLAAGQYDDTAFQVAHRWPLYFPAAQVGQSKSIDVQVRMASAGGAAGGSCKIEFGRSATASYGAVIFKATALPATAAMYVYTDGL